MLLKNVIKKEFNEGFFECVIMTSWVTLLLRHFIRVRDNAWNPRVFVETGGEGKTPETYGGRKFIPSNPHGVHVARQVHAPCVEKSPNRGSSTTFACL